MKDVTSIKVAKMHLYPAEEPSGWAVGFVFTLENGRSNYLDTVVSLADCENKTDEEIGLMALKKLKHSAKAWAKENKGKSSLVGTLIEEPDDPDPIPTISGGG